MAEAAALSPQECPVCHEDYTDPKILPCTHLVCQKCVLSWLKTQGKHAGCPLCRQPILYSTEQGQGDFYTLVDALPTDHATKIKIESQRTLSSSYICNVCDSDSAAAFFCLQCDIKLCGSCFKVHSKLPSSLNHVVKELRSLTAEQLAADRRFPCTSHQEEAAELYCTSHEELICFLCAASTHRKCTGVEEVGISAKTQRQELEDQNKRLRQREVFLKTRIKHIDDEVADARTKFGYMRTEIFCNFGELQRVIEDRQETLLDDVQEMEEVFLEEKLSRRSKLEKLRSTLAAHVDSVDTVVASAPDKALLATLGKLKSRLDDLEAQKAINADDAPKNMAGVVFFDENMLNSLKKALGVTGEVRDSPKAQSKLQRCLACDTVTEGTFQFVVSNVKNLKHGVKSQCCVIRNLPWTIFAQPETKAEDSEKYLGFYLSCDLPSTMNLWSCNVSAELRILKTAPGIKHYSNQMQQKFSGLQNEGCSSSWGYAHFISMEELLDPQNGYVKGGSVTLEVHLVADDPEGLW